MITYLIQMVDINAHKSTLKIKSQNTTYSDEDQILTD